MFVCVHECVYEREKKRLRERDSVFMCLVGWAYPCQVIPLLLLFIVAIEILTRKLRWTQE